MDSLQCRSLLAAGRNKLGGLDWKVKSKQVESTSAHRSSREKRNGVPALHGGWINAFSVWKIRIMDGIKAPVELNVFWLAGEEDAYEIWISLGNFTSQRKRRHASGSTPQRVPGSRPGRNLVSGRALPSTCVFVCVSVCLLVHIGEAIVWSWLDFLNEGVIINSFSAWSNWDPRSRYKTFQFKSRNVEGILDEEGHAPGWKGICSAPQRLSTHDLVLRDWSFPGTLFIPTEGRKILKSLILEIFSSRSVFCHVKFKIDGLPWRRCQDF